MRITLTNGTVIEVSEGFEYTVSDEVTLSVETIAQAVIGVPGFGVTTALIPSDNGGEPEEIKVLLLEDGESKLKVLVPLSVEGAAQLALDLLGLTHEQLAALLAKPEIETATEADLRRLPPNQG